ncbi:MAG: type IX secretion system membrane protein PorP/SprF [Bacteroidetes bacterium]|nr:MAG: type IX secretion system membrane protein PorP/SprF [Bacteroidota bacterium]
MRNLYFIFLLLCCNYAVSQDIHWTQFNENPVFLNPAHSGNFRGDHRFHLNFRDQWRSVTKPFQTFSMSYDTRMKNPDYGLGVCLFHDQAGDGIFRTIELQVNPSYRRLLTQDSVHRIQLGAHLALNHRQFQFNQFYFDEQYNGFIFDPSIPNTEALNTDKKTNLSIGAGFIYQYYMDKRHQFNFGFSVFNLNQPNQGFYGTVVRRDVRFNLFFQSRINIYKDLDLNPTAMLQMQGTYREILAGANLKYHLDPNPNHYRAVNAGLMFRSKDSFFFTAGLDYQNWYAGVSYDVNISSLKPASSGRGGLEISLRYIIIKFKPNKHLHRICPEYI